MKEKPLKHKIAFNEQVKEQFRATENADGTFGGENSPKQLVGHAIVTDVVADGPWWTEEVSREAVTSVFEKDLTDIRALWNHDSSQPLAIYPDSLALEQDEKGLLSTITPIKTSFSDDLMNLVEAGVVKKMSFGFYILDEERIQKKDGVDHFVIKEIELIEVSPVTFPFYKQTDLQARGYITNPEELLQARLRKHGIPEKLIREKIKLQRDILHRKLNLRRKKFGINKKKDLRLQKIT